MEKVDGERGGTFVYEYDGFWYHADTDYPGRRFVCTAKTLLCRCKATALVKNGVVTVRRVHSHPPPQTRIRRPAMKDLKKLVKEQIQLAPRDVMNRVSNQHIEAAIKIKPHSAQTAISNARSEMLPRILETLGEFVAIKEILFTNLMSSYYGHFKSSDGKYGLCSRVRSCWGLLDITAQMNCL
ncbi:hypothetical protein PV326_010204 [Microctonus aethiopoides]|nr:hypothetical protein PV326_010204 [Microctonus aethiopoides]